MWARVAVLGGRAREVVRSYIARGYYRSRNRGTWDTKWCGRDTVVPEILVAPSSPVASHVDGARSSLTYQGQLRA